MPSEFPYELRLVRGLRPERRLRDKSTGYLEQLRNLRPAEDGLSPLEYAQNPLHPTLGISWPFPQLLREQQVTLLCYERTLYEVDETDWSLTQLTTYDAADGVTAADIVPGGIWHLVAFEENWVATNGSSVVMKMPNTQGSAYVASGSTVSTVGMFGGSMFFGGVAGSRFSGSAWGEIFEEWRNFIGDSVITFENQGLDVNWLLWSEAGGGDVLWPFVGILNALGFDVTSNFDLIREALYDQMSRGWMGMIPLDTRGTVLQVKPLRRMLAVYTEDAVYVVQRSENSLSVQRVSDYGIRSRGAVAGGLDEHVYIASDGDLWRLRESGGAERLGYKEYVGTLDNASLVSAYDPRERDFYFSDAHKGFSYVSGQELTELTSGYPTGLFRSSAGVLTGVMKGSTPAEFSIISNPGDMDFTGQKTMSFMEMDYSDIESLESRMHFRMNRKANFVKTRWLGDANTGTFYHGVAFDEAKIELKGKLDDDTKLERVTLRLQYQDDRTVRGPRGTGLEEV